MGVLGSARVSRVGFGFSRKQAFSPLALVPLFFRPAARNSDAHLLAPELGRLQDG